MTPRERAEALVTDLDSEAFHDDAVAHVEAAFRDFARALLADDEAAVEVICVERCIREQKRHRKRLEDPIRSPNEETAPGIKLWMRWIDEVRGDLAALRKHRGVE